MLQERHQLYKHCHGNRIQICFKGHSKPIHGQNLEHTSRSQNQPEPCSTTRGKPMCCLNFPSLILKLKVLNLIIQFYTEKDLILRAHM